MSEPTIHPSAIAALVVARTVQTMNVLSSAVLHDCLVPFLTLYKLLCERGVITPEEYAAAKSEIEGLWMVQRALDPAQAEIKKAIEDFQENIFRLLTGKGKKPEA